MSEKFLELLNISKTFPGVKALDHVKFDIYPGEVHALVGENGAGLKFSQGFNRRMREEESLSRERKSI